MIIFKYFLRFLCVDKSFLEFCQAQFKHAKSLLAFATQGSVKVLYKQVFHKSGPPLNKKNDRNGGIWQSGISKSLEYVQRPVRFVNVVVFA